MIAEQDWVLVTNNAIEFRGRFSAIELHPGIIFLLPAVRRPDQIRLFGAALEHMKISSEMINRALDVAFDPNGRVTVTPYDLP